MPRRCDRRSQTSRCGTPATPRWTRPAVTWASRKPTCCARVDLIRRTRRADAAGVGIDRAIAGLAATGREDSRATPTQLRCASRLLWSVWGWVRCRIDAHSAAVPAVQAAAPATWSATRTAGMPVWYWTIPTRACATTRATRTRSRLITERGAATANNPAPRPINRLR